MEQAFIVLLSLQMTLGLLWCSLSFSIVNVNKKITLKKNSTLESYITQILLRLGLMDFVAIELQLSFILCLKIISEHALGD